MQLCQRSIENQPLILSTESSPNVEYGKMWSEPDECALGLDLRGTRSAFYFYYSEARNVSSLSSSLNLIRLRLGLQGPFSEGMPANGAAGVAIAMEHCSDRRQIGAYLAHSPFEIAL